MSRTITLEQVQEGKLDDFDKEYLRQRPWLLETFKRQGAEEQVKEIEDGTYVPDSPAEESRVTTDMMRQGVIPTDRKPQPNGVSGSSDDDEDEAYEDWTAADLKAEIEDRNQGREADQKIPISGTKQELADRLYADDEKSSNA